VLITLRTWLEDSRDRLWFLPAILTLTAIVLAALTAYVDLYWIGPVPTGGEIGLLFRGGADEARSMLETIAGSVITVTGIIFSIALVALRAASEQFSSRVLRNFTSDRPSQLTLGIFTATFVYSLMILRLVRPEGEAGGPFVPALSVTIAFGLALTSIGFLIFFISYVAREIQAVGVVERVAKEILRRVDHLFPVEIGHAAVPRDEEFTIPTAPPAVIRAEVSGYVTEIDEAALFRHARGRLLIRMDIGVGAFVVPGVPIASVWPADLVDARLARSLRAAFVIGRERTIHHDIEHGFIELSDIAVRSLSAAINDPTTVNISIDWLSEALIALGRREFPSPIRTDPDGRVWLIAKQTDYERVVSIALDPIRHYAGDDPSVLRRLLEALHRIVAWTPAERHAPLRAQGEAILRTAEANLSEPLDLLHVRRAARWLRPEAGDRAA